MKNAATRSLASLAVLVSLAVCLVVLAVLQYRWISQISEADGERMRAGLENAVRQFRQEFNRELLNLCIASEPRRRQIEREDWDSVAERLENWRQISLYPGMVSEVYLWETKGDEQPAAFLRLDRGTRAFEAAEVPPALTGIQERLEDRRGVGRRLRFGEGRVFVWSVSDGRPLIIHPMVEFDRRRGEGRPSLQLSGYVVIELDRDFLGNVVLPELAQRYFFGSEGLEYDVAVVDPRNGTELLYRSSDDLDLASFRSADVRAELLWEPRDYFAALRGDAGEPFNGQPLGSGPPPGPPGPRPFDKGAGGGGFRRQRTPVILLNLDEPGWQLAAKYRQGSLEAVVAGLRRRNLAISFGILVLLAVSMGMIYVSAQRSRRLADLQMEFVAGVSHELRTPLAVIRSAADNLADGVVAGGVQVKEYGKVIGREGRRLSTMVEQTLQFAGAQTGAKAYELGPVSVEAAVKRALDEFKPAIEEAGFEVETAVEPELPAALSNEEALSRVLANLVQNALKYGGDSRWMALRARAASANGKREIELKVEDRGPGIDADDLPHIFEPFYRGKLALSNQIQGSGLGLNLAQRTSRAVGARLTVESHAGRGTSFMIHLPVAEMDSTSSLRST